MYNNTTNKATKVTMERALQRSANASLGGNEEEIDDVWGRICGEDSMARTFKTEGLWEFARLTLRYNNPVDPLQPLAVMAAEKVAEHMPTAEDGKLAPHHVALINNTGIKRRTTGDRWDKFFISIIKEKKREEQEIVSSKAGQLPMGEHGDREGLKRNHDDRKEKTAAVNKGMKRQEGGRKEDEGGNGKE